RSSTIRTSQWLWRRFGVRRKSERRTHSFSRPPSPCRRTGWWKGAAQNALVSYGEAILDVMAHFVRDQDEDIWVRRHIPGTLARIPSQKSVDLLTELLGDPDGFIRYKALTAIETITHDHPEFTLDRARLEALTLNE